MAETIGKCEACGKTIFANDPYATTVDGVTLCEDDAFTLANAVAQMTEALNAVPFEMGEYDFDTRAEFKAHYLEMKSELESNGDRKLLTSLGGCA